MLTQQDPNTRAFECAVEVHHCDQDHKLQDTKFSESSDKSDLKTVDESDFQVIVFSGNVPTSRRMTKNIEITSFDKAFAPYLKPPV